MNQHVKTILVWVVILVALVVVIRFFSQGSEVRTTLTQTEFYRRLDAGKVAEVTITGDEFGYQIQGKLEDGTGFSTYTVKDEKLLAHLREKGVAIRAERPRDGTFLVSLLSWAPMLLFIGVWIFFMRQMQSGGNKALSFGKSRAKLLTPSGKKVTFADVAGCEEAKEELQEIIEFLRTRSGSSGSAERSRRASC